MLIAYWLLLVFVFGAVVGSFLNVAIARLPYEKSLIWPGSCCGHCHQPVRWYDNLPLISYLWLRGRCRSCGTRFSPAYLLVELGTALGFVGLALIEVIGNVHAWPTNPPILEADGFYPWQRWAGAGYHALLMSFLIVASVCDLKSRYIPLSLTLTGTLIGLIGATLLPWPWPQDPAQAAPVFALNPAMAWQAGGAIGEGVYLWPFWGPLPGGFMPDHWLTGLATGLAGALTGTFLLRAVGFLASRGLGKEALGIGDADLMMMAGAFLGWQPIVVGFFLSVVPALVFAIVLVIARNDHSLPFGPSLSIGVLAALLGWPWIATYPGIRTVFFWGSFLVWMVVIGAVFLFFISLALRRFRGDPAVDEGA